MLFSSVSPRWTIVTLRAWEEKNIAAWPAALPGPRLGRRAGAPGARHAGGEAEVVLDPGGRARLAAGRLALDDDRLETFRGAVDGRRQAGGGRTHDHRGVLRGGGLGRDAQQLGHAPQLGS